MTFFLLKNTGIIIEFTILEVEPKVSMCAGHVLYHLIMSPLLASFLSTVHKLRSSGERKPQVIKYLYQIDLQASLL